ncbi:hypothetical protein BAMBUS_00840 [Brevundimonas phage vB_BpoS-Bambus]|nr:hypothetical protein BAMBUS_00840 [Brevundimonas phage vB_BpoS-Bambus]
MTPGYRVKPVVDGRIRNRYGYEQRVGPGAYTIIDADDNPIRVHNGFAVFTSVEQAAWCVELMRVAFFEGEASVKAAMRNLLDIPEPPDDDED